MNEQRRGFLKGLAALIPLAAVPVTILGHEGEQRTPHGRVEKIEGQPGRVYTQWRPQTHIFTFPRASREQLHAIREYLTFHGFKKETTLLFGGDMCDGMEVRVLE